MSGATGPLLTEEQRAKLAQRLAMRSRDRSDVGQALPMTAAALAVGAADDCGAARLEALVEALGSERVIVPVPVEADPRVAGVHANADPDRFDIDFVRVDAAAGPALAVYTCAESLAADRPGDRPMALEARRACLAALVETSGRLLVDPAGAAVLVPRPATAALAQGDRWLPAWRDAELASELRRLAGVGGAGGGPVTDVRVRYAGEGTTRVEIEVDPDYPRADARVEVDAAVRAVGASPRLAAAADRIELTPVRAERRKAR
ncbi:SseB family protein [Actinomyces sp. B33]|uniref:SseB family protein n=1 Tax=Actinomyces sp. B33 TaxID=2942131 RepID=UPI00234013EB|nr:SseB family protein [Actinomyces sp. B33]MDC4233101.1 SseB family protein [Actinomyces sp. B33]